ncbi:MAG: PAS domain-containing sensor histidine kinase [Bacteroidia bacterium]|nr:PAS domain-containing sensor histidine kinase [Bacteroidia bacterium]
MLITSLCFIASDYIGYRIVALVLLVVVSLLSLLFDMIPVISAATLSALIWNFFFIPPLFTFHISNAEDLLMFLLYFVIALVHAVLSANIKRAEEKIREKEEQARTLMLYDSLLNSLSHELRTPLAAIISAVDVLKENQDKLSTESHEELLQQIDTAAMRLNRQVENLLNMSRLESGQLALHLDWCDVNELIHNVLQKLETTGHSTQFKHNDELPLFLVDSGLLQQAIYNIVHNAVLYTPPKSVIEIETTQTKKGLKITISDNGEGLSPEALAKVFDKFYRANQSKTGGSGLGLSIVKGFIEAHHGSIDVVQNSKGGLQFTIQIPSPVMSVAYEQN